MLSRMPREHVYEETSVMGEYKTDSIALQFSETWNWSRCYSESIKQVQNIVSSFVVAAYKIYCLIWRVAFFPNLCCLETEFEKQAVSARALQKRKMKSMCLGGKCIYLRLKLGCFSFRLGIFHLRFLKTLPPSLYSPVTYSKPASTNLQTSSAVFATAL